jgi:hypothetical protein
MAEIRVRAGHRHGRPGSAAKIESSRRHGHYDPRWHTNRLNLRNRAADRGPAVEAWENEGGALLDDRRAGPGGGWLREPAGLEWYAFLTRYFPSQRRHDLEALKAYEEYRAAGVARVPIASVA